MKLMVLGGGNCQLNLIKRAKERGHFIILIDYLKNPVGRAFSDIHLRISTFDKGKILLAAIDNRIEGIITLGTDQPILVCAYIAMKLNLHFYIDELIALNVTNKRFMKQKFIDNHIPTVKYVLIKKDFSDKELDNISFPIILKPVDSQGQRGIFKLYSIDEIREKIDITLSYSRDNVVLIEEFYKNDEITVNGWIDNGHFTMISVVDRVTIKDKDSVGVCLCHNYPSIYLNKYYNEINRLTLKIIKSFNICNGPIYFQYLVGEDGIKVNEIAMRIGGAYEDITIPILSNIDILDLLLTYIEKGKIKNDQLMKYEKYNRKVKGCIKSILYNKGKPDIRKY